MVSGRHANHFVCASSITASSPAFSCKANAFFDGSRIPGRRRLFSFSSKRYGLQFSPLASPDAEEDHETGTAELETPPEKLCGQFLGVESGDDEIDKVDGQGEVGNEFGSSDEE